MKLIATILKFSGIALLVLAPIGLILAQFDYVLVIKGSELPKIDLPVAIALVVVGLIFFFPGHFMLKRADRKEKQTDAPKLDINNLGFIENALRKTRKRNLIMGICFTAFGLAFMLPAALAPDEVGTGGAVFLIVMGLLSLGLGIWALVQFNKLINIHDTEIYSLIMTNPQSIGKVEATIFRSKLTKVGQTINVLVFVDGKKKGLLNMNENELELFRQYISKYNSAVNFDVKEQLT